MGIFRATGQIHVRGFKELTSGSDIIEFSNVKTVHLPIVGPNGTDLEVFVKEGDSVLIGTKIAQRKDFIVPVYSPVSGTVLNTEMRFHAGLGRPIKHLIIENNMKNERLDMSHLLVKEDCSQQDIVKAIQEAGIVGLGGAGFPTYVKYLNCTSIDAVIINGVECEPYLTTDYFAEQNETELMLQGAMLLKKASGANRVLFAIKEGKVAVKNQLESLIEKYPEIQICEVPDVYPMGWERTLIRKLVHREYSKLPIEASVIVNNAQTAAAVAKALLKGEIMTHRLVTVSGEAMAHCCNVYALIGSLASEIIASAGGYLPEVEQCILLAGGPMTSKAQLNDTFALTPNIGGLVAKKRIEYEALPCLRCGRCTMVCPALIQPVEIKIAVEGKNVDRIKALQAEACVECGLCSFVCPSKIDVTEFVKKAKIQLKIAQAKANIKK